jgi:hypothetical protein
MDLDCANPFLFPPSDYSGIAVLRMPRRFAQHDVDALMGVFINALAKGDISGKLWIVERRGIREYLPDEPLPP